MTVGEDRRKKLLQLASALVFIAILVVAVLIVASNSDSGGGDAENVGDAGAVNASLEGIPQDGMTLGEPGAKVTLIEFGDLKCPVCKAFSEEIIPPVIDSQVRSGKSKIVFHNYTIIDEQSRTAGAAALAAGEQGRGWNFVELFYRNQGLEASGYVTDEFLTEVARGAGVPDVAQWNKDRESAAVLGQVQNETGEAERLGLTGTPSFVITGPSAQGKEVLGTPGSAGALEEAIDAAG
jgi:protein-disulfide isomerase